MWMGLVTGDHNLYTLGAGAFVAEQRPPVDPALLRDAELASMLASVDGAARDAIAATDDDARAARYGHLLATCARCHAALGRGGPAE
jgi:cytochrome c553